MHGGGGEEEAEEAEVAEGGCMGEPRPTLASLYRAFLVPKMGFLLEKRAQDIGHLL